MTIVHPESVKRMDAPNPLDLKNHRIQCCIMRLDKPDKACFLKMRTIGTAKLTTDKRADRGGYGECCDG